MEEKDLNKEEIEKEDADTEVQPDEIEEANKKANKLVDEIKCENLFHRTDIGAKAYKK